MISQYFILRLAWLLFAEHGISQGQRCHNQVVVWLILAERLQRVARLCCGNLCSTGIAVKTLRQSQHDLSNNVLELRIKVELSLPGLQQSNGLSVISFKPQLIDLDSECRVTRSLRVYS